MRILKKTELSVSQMGVQEDGLAIFLGKGPHIPQQEALTSEDEVSEGLNRATTLHMSFIGCPL